MSGKLVTHEYTVEGPVMIFLTTTAQEVDEELLNRCIVLSVNEEREQTRAIHRIQRESRTLDGHWARRERAGSSRCTATRNGCCGRSPWSTTTCATMASFPDYMTRMRRDHMKLLTLIEAIALCISTSGPSNATHATARRWSTSRPRRRCEAGRGADAPGAGPRSTSCHRKPSGCSRSSRRW